LDGSDGGSDPPLPTKRCAFVPARTSTPCFRRHVAGGISFARTNRVKLPDAIIQATAEESGRILITRNTRDFPEGTPGVLIPYTL